MCSILNASSVVVTLAATSKAGSALVQSPPNGRAELSRDVKCDAGDLSLLGVLPGVTLDVNGETVDKLGVHGGIVFPGTTQQLVRNGDDLVVRDARQFVPVPQQESFSACSIQNLSSAFVLVTGALGSQVVAPTILAPGSSMKVSPCATRIPSSQVNLRLSVGAAYFTVSPAQIAALANNPTRQVLSLTTVRLDGRLAAFSLTRAVNGMLVIHQADSTPPATSLGITDPAAASSPSSAGHITPVSPVIAKGTDPNVTIALISTTAVFAAAFIVFLILWLVQRQK